MSVSMSEFAIGSSNERIKIVINDWTSQIVMSNIAAIFFQEMGYKASFVQLTTDAQWSMISRGHIHLQLEVWEGTMATQYQKLMDNNRIIDLGNHNAKTREDWWYPDYVEEQCPGLPDWKALLGCSELFTNEKSNGKGIYLGGPWEKPDAKRIRVLGLNFNVERVSHGDQLWIELEQAYNKRKPIVLFNWTPNWIEYKYKGKFVEFPEYSTKCETDPSWGINPEATYDCGNPKNGWLKKIAWIKFPNKWPCAYQVANKMNFTNELIAELVYWVDGQYLTHLQAAQQWIKTKKHIWQQWIPPECKRDSMSIYDE
ncbi:ABC transporter substrate-binding protein [Endozoicomonas sp. SM1973]|uniref:ABC transporter substrate-binding protein n=1 Tax=Spartinivicinus marinus TaxID=2994442 RepID=A0A853IFM5_9GAMM|nr:ABC transporter substrate-binding protein [Spartinivicinus marinus]MCX4025681.1 ABC transporter substrate-binding protein [Spartinivicinus marinus]NYZ68297.1 ABC transporter substrate-binding protein [Spartinivicinus marinus]